MRLLFLLLAGAAILGNTVNYSIGHFVGPRVFRADDASHRLLNRQHLDRAHAFFEKYGGMAVVLTRFVPIVRTFVPFVAGAGAMRYPTFALYNVAAVCSGWDLPRGGLRVRERAGREEQLLAGRARDRRRVDDPDAGRVAEAQKKRAAGLTAALSEFRPRGFRLQAEAPYHYARRTFSARGPFGP